MGEFAKKTLNNNTCSQINIYSSRVKTKKLTRERNPHLAYSRSLVSQGGDLALVLRDDVILVPLNFTDLLLQDTQLKTNSRDPNTCENFCLVDLRVYFFSRSQAHTFVNAGNGHKDQFSVCTNASVWGHNETG